MWRIYRNQLKLLIESEEIFAIINLLIGVLSEALNYFYSNNTSKKFRLLDSHLTL